ncbi:Histone-lysine N-methyltransferase SETMAR, partial [Harpegnathos saltator]
KKKILFHQDNAPAHSARDTTDKLKKLRYELVPHPPYSPDLAPSDYFLFPRLKQWLAGKRFYSNEEVKLETNAYFEGLDTEHYKTGIEMLADRYTKCITLNGDYV